MITGNGSMIFCKRSENGKNRLVTSFSFREISITFLLNFLGLNDEEAFKIVDRDFDGFVSKEDLGKFLH